MIPASNLEREIIIYTTEHGLCPAFFKSVLIQFDEWEFILKILVEQANKNKILQWVGYSF